MVIRLADFAFEQAYRRDSPFRQSFQPFVEDFLEADDRRVCSHLDGFIQISWARQNLDAVAKISAGQVQTFVKEFMACLQLSADRYKFRIKACLSFEEKNKPSV